MVNALMDSFIAAIFFVNIIKDVVASCGRILRFMEAIDGLLGAAHILDEALCLVEVNEVHDCVVRRVVVFALVFPHL